jgi:hypothetical protein
MSLRTRHRRPGRLPGSARGVVPGPWLALLLAVVLTATLGPAVPCRAAGLDNESPNVNAAPGSSGWFDVLLGNSHPAGDARLDVAADSLGLSSVGPRSVTLTDVSINTVAARSLDMTSEATVPGGLPLSLGTSPTTPFTASDSEFASPGLRTVNLGQSFGLAHVSFAISPTSPGGADAIACGSLTTSLSDQNGNAIPVCQVSGAIATVAVPAALAGAAPIGLGSFWWRRKGQRATVR